MFWWLDKQLREIRGTPHYAIAELPEVTIGRIVGVAKPLDGKTAEAALSGRTCLAYMAKAVGSTGSSLGVEVATNFHGSSNKLDIAVDVGGVPFLVEDDTGVAIVDPAGARGALGVDEKSTWWKGPLERQEAFLARFGVNPGSWSVDCYEGIVSIGEKIAVVGFGQRVDGRLRMSSSPKLPLVICDNLATLKM